MFTPEECRAGVVPSKPRVQPVNEAAVLPVYLIASVPHQRAPEDENNAVETTGIVVTMSSAPAESVVWARFAAINRSLLLAMLLGYIAIVMSYVLACSLLGGRNV